MQRWEELVSGESVYKSQQEKAICCACSAQRLNKVRGLAAWREATVACKASTLNARTPGPAFLLIILVPCREHTTCPTTCLS